MPPYDFESPPTPHTMRSGGRWQPPWQMDHRFGRMFPNLPAWQPPGTSEAERIKHLRDIAAAMVADDSVRSENPAVSAAYTYFGQMMAHDITFAAGPLSFGSSAADAPENPRTPRFDLDSAYGHGPADQPYLYDALNRVLFRIGVNESGEPDLPRTDGAGTTFLVPPVDDPRRAVIGDSRNDENVILAQLHLAVLKFHNRQVESGRSFTAARQQTTWHYQWLILHDYLPRVCGTCVVDAVARGTVPPTFDPRTHSWIPVEFAAAAFRFGHAMVRSRYTLNDALGRDQKHGRPILRETSNSLAGGRRLPQDWTIQWDHFVAAGDRTPQASMAIAEHLPEDFRRLPSAIIERGPADHANLAMRTLLRGLQLGIPSGQSIARRLGMTPMEGDDPLWIYILREAATQRNGSALGDLGARLVAEVVIGLLRADPFSYHNVDPLWTPRSAGPAYCLLDFLRDAGMPIDDRDWYRLRNRRRFGGGG